MKNRSPIILNCFSRGGSNILWNVLLSHPQVCSPIQETLEIFRLDWRDLRWPGIQAAWQTRQLGFFDQWNLHPRAPISAAAQAFIDETLFQWKLKTLQNAEMRYKAQNVLYTADEVVDSRLVLKNNNGITFLSDRFLDMYPDAVFLALVRDPIPLYESHKRHSTPAGKSPETFAAFYEAMVRRMQADAARWPSYRVLRFEDLLGDSLNSIHKIYEWTGLDITQVPLMRFKAKPHMQADGRHTTNFEAGRHYWFPFSKIQRILEPEVNKFQVSRLSADEIGHLRELTRSLCMELGYSEK